MTSGPEAVPGACEDRPRAVPVPGYPTEPEAPTAPDMIAKACRALPVRLPGPSPATSHGYPGPRCTPKKVLKRENIPQRTITVQIATAVVSPRRERTRVPKKPTVATASAPISSATATTVAATESPTSAARSVKRWTIGTPRIAKATATAELTPKLGPSALSSPRNSGPVVRQGGFLRNTFQIHVHP